jgi:hypothetical protein
MSVWLLGWYVSCESAEAIEMNAIRQLGLFYMFATTVCCIIPSSAHGDDLNLVCYAGSGQNDKKNYSVFWIDSQNSIITVGSAAGVSNDPDNLKVGAVSWTGPVTVSPEAFAFRTQVSSEKIDRKTGVYIRADGKQERCWKGTVPLPK